MPLYYDQAPSSGPVDLTELKDHLNIGSTSDYDAVLQMLMEAAYDQSEINNPVQWSYKRQLIEATLIFTTSKLPQPVFELPRPPLISVTSLEYRDDDGVWQTIATGNYQVNADADPGFIYIDDDYTLPDTYDDEPYPIRVKYKAGYSDSGTSTYQDVPANIRLWIMNHIGDYFHERSASIITNMEIVELKAAMGRLMAPHNMARRFG